MLQAYEPQIMTLVYNDPPPGYASPSDLSYGCPQCPGVPNQPDVEPSAHSNFRRDASTVAIDPCARLSRLDRV